MPESVARRDLLYETAISIGVEPDLRRLLRAVLPGMAKRFGCVLAAVVQADLSSGDEGLFRTEFVVPNALMGGEEYASMLERLPELLPDRERQRLLIEENGSYRYIFRLEGFGFLFLVRSLPFDEHFLRDFEPLLKMLGGACGASLEMERRIAAELELRRRSELQRLLIDLSLEFINVPLERLDPSIEKSLEDMGRFVRADRAYLFSYDFERGVMNNTHEWCAPGIEPALEELQEVPNADFPEWVHAHRHGNTVHIPDVGALPPGALRDILSPQGIKSLITLPLGEGDGCLGYVGFDAVAERRVWTPDDVMLLRVFAQLLMNAELRRRHEIEILEAHKEIGMAYRRLQQSAEKINSLALEAQAANIAKGRFLATMSHELRTPLNAILGMTSLLRETPLDEKQHERLTAVAKSGTELLRIIDDILDFSKVDEGSFEKLEFPLRSIFDNAPFRTKEARSGEPVEVSWKIAPDVPPRIVGDPLRISRVFNNIVGNALKFTRAGRVEISVDVHADGGGRFLCFTVRDTGIGMTEEQMERLFEPFVQGDSSSTRRYGGTGLGLPLSKKIVEMMGGTISVRSAPGEGSVFVFTVPMELPSSSPPSRESAPPPSVRGLRLLLVEDEAVSRALLKRLLEKQGASVSVAVNGAEAVKAVEEGEFDCVLMDVNMPVMGGYEATAVIRRTRPSLPILGLSAGEAAQNRAPALAAGMNDFLTKPVVAEELVAAAARLVEGGRVPEAVGARPGVDFEAGLASTGGNALFYGQMLSKFLRTYGAIDGEIARALAEGRADEARRLAHSVKGVAGSLGATELQERAAVLEREVAEGREVSAPLAAFGKALAEALDAIGKRVGAGAPLTAVVPADGRTAAALLDDLEAALSARKPKPAKECVAALAALFPSGESAEDVRRVKEYVDRYRFQEALAALNESPLRRAAEARPE